MKIELWYKSLPKWLRFFLQVICSPIWFPIALFGSIVGIIILSPFMGIIKLVEMWEKFDE